MKLAVIIFFIMGWDQSRLDEMSFRPFQFTVCILEFSQFSQDLHVKHPRILKSALTLNLLCAKRDIAFFFFFFFFVKAYTCLK